MASSEQSSESTAGLWAIDSEPIQAWGIIIIYLTIIIPPAQMGSEAIAHEAEGRMGYWLTGHESCLSNIQLVGKKSRDKTTLASKTWFSRHHFGFQSRRFPLLVGYNI